MDILVVIDMQNDFIDGALGTPEAVEIVPAVAEKIRQYREAGNPVVFTRDTHGPDYLETQEGKKLPVPHCIKGTEGWEIIDQLRPYIRDINPRTYYRKRKEAVEVLSSVLWGYTSQDSAGIVREFMM